MKNLKSYLTILALVLLAGVTQGQETSSYSELLDKTSKTIRSLENNWVRAENTAVNPLILESLFITRKFESGRLQHTVDSLRASQIRNDVGLRTFVSANENLNQGNEDFDNFSKTRINAGVDFNLLQNGWKYNRAKAALMEHDLALESYDSYKVAKKESYSFIYNQIVFHFNAEKINLLKQRSGLLQQWLDIFYELYYSHDISYSDLLEIKNRIAESDRSLLNYQNYNAAFETTLLEEEKIKISQLPAFPVVDLNLDSLLMLVQNSPEEISRNQLLLSRLEVQDDLTDKSNLRFYARMNFYNRKNNPTMRSFPSIGFTWTRPLKFGNNSKTRLKLERELVHVETEDEHFSLTKEVLNEYYDFQYQLKSFTGLMFDLEKEKERIRINKLQKESYNISNAELIKLRLVDNVFEMHLRMLDLQQKMYLQILKIHTLIPYERVAPYIIPFTSPLKRGDRAIVASFSTFLSNDLRFCMNYLRKNKISHVILKGNSKRDEKLISALRLEGFRISYLPTDLYVEKARMKQKEIPAFVRSENEVWVDVSAFKNRVELERYLDELPSQTGAIIRDFKQLLATEYKSIK